MKSWPSANFCRLREEALFGKLICMGCMRIRGNAALGTAAMRADIERQSYFNHTVK